MTSGTTMHGTRQPLRTWMLAAFSFLNAMNGISAPQLQDRLGLKRHETAYRMLRTLRESVPDPWAHTMDGVALVEEMTLAWTPEGGERGPTVLAVVCGDQIRMSHVLAPTKTKALAVIKAALEEGSTVLTDVLPPDDLLARSGYLASLDPDDQGSTGGSLKNAARILSSRLRVWNRKVLHGAVTGSNLQPYLDEFTYRYNAPDVEVAFQAVLGIGPAMRRAPE